MDNLGWGYEMVTDPAKELAELCEKLSTNSGKRGDDHIAAMLGVEPWSREFYQIIFQIIERIDLISGILGKLEIDDDLKNDAGQNLRRIKSAFNRESLHSSWDARGRACLGRENTGPIKMLSVPVRAVVSYPKLSQAEIDDVLEQVEKLLVWLRDQQLKEHDFVRQSIIEGLEHFEFRLSRINWLGWGYTVEALREVVSAYLILQGMVPQVGNNPVEEVILKKLGGLLKNIYSYAKATKEGFEAADFFLRMYGAYSISTQATQDIAGLIASGSPIA